MWSAPAAAVLVASPAALALPPAFSADVNGNEKDDGDRQEDPVDPMAAREIPESHAGLDRADNTEYPVAR